MRWLLIGDDGQHDEELYAEFAAEHPDNVAAVAIRRLSTGEAVLAGGRTKAEQHGAEAPWVSASDGSTIADRLGEHRPALSRPTAPTRRRPAPVRRGRHRRRGRARVRRMRASPRLTWRAQSGPR